MALLVGYARVSTDKQDAQALATAGVPVERMYVDAGLTGANRSVDVALALPPEEGR